MTLGSLMEQIIKLLKGFLKSFINPKNNMAKTKMNKPKRGGKRC
jgi:hypothetical protein